MPFLLLKEICIFFVLLQGGMKGGLVFCQMKEAILKMKQIDETLTL